MRKLLVILGLLVGAGLLAATPARADSFGFSIGYSSGDFDGFISYRPYRYYEVYTPIAYCYDPYYDPYYYYSDYYYYCPPPRRYSYYCPPPAHYYRPIYRPIVYDSWYRPAYYGYFSYRHVDYDRHHGWKNDWDHYDRDWKRHDNDRDWDRHDNDWDRNDRNNDRHDRDWDRGGNNWNRDDRNRDGDRRGGNSDYRSRSVNSRDYNRGARIDDTVLRDQPRVDRRDSRDSNGNRTSGDRYRISNDGQTRRLEKGVDGRRLDDRFNDIMNDRRNGSDGRGRSIDRSNVAPNRGAGNDRMRIVDSRDLYQSNTRDLNRNRDSQGIRDNDRSAIGSDRFSGIDRRDLRQGDRGNSLERATRDLDSRRYQADSRMRESRGDADSRDRMRGIDRSGNDSRQRIGRDIDRRQQRDVPTYRERGGERGQSRVDRSPSVDRGSRSDGFRSEGSRSGGRSSDGMRSGGGNRGGGSRSGGGVDGRSGRGR